MVSNQLTVECPTCGAPIGVHCRRDDGSHAAHPHYLRIAYGDEEDKEYTKDLLTFQALGDGGYRSRRIAGAE